MTNYATILSRKYKGKQWTLDGDGYDGLIWLDAGTKPTQAALDKLADEVGAEIEAEITAQAAAKKSAIAKLAALGLTESEIKAITGGN